MNITCFVKKLYKIIIDYLFLTSNFVDKKVRTTFKHIWI